LINSNAYTDPLLALQNFKGGLYHLLLLDIKMPKMDGIELFDRMKKEDDEVKVCFFSASEHLTFNYKKLFQSSDRFLSVSKLISISEMTKQIKQFMSRQ
jgi:two-component system, OmpR family, response regulator ChvI